MEKTKRNVYKICRKETQTKEKILVKSQFDKMNYGFN